MPRKTGPRITSDDREDCVPQRLVRQASSAGSLAQSSRDSCRGSVARRRGWLGISCLAGIRCWKPLMPLQVLFLSESLCFWATQTNKYLRPRARQQ